MEFPYRLEKMIMERIELNRARLTECRERLGLSKREAAKRMNMSQPAYLRYESGERTPSIHVVQTMADVLSTSVDYLLGNNDDDSPDPVNDLGVPPDLNQWPISNANLQSD